MPFVPDLLPCFAQASAADLRVPLRFPGLYRWAQSIAHVLVIFEVFGSF